MSWSRSMNWFGRRKPRRAARRASNSFKPSLEQLEDRTLLSAAIWTNRPDYLPGQIATVTGSGFRVGETVDVHVVNLTSGAQYAPWSVTDGGAGDLDGKADQTIQTAWTVPDNALHSTLQLTATGLTSGEMAQATFTDGFGLSKLRLGRASGSEDYVYTAGNKIFPV